MPESSATKQYTLNAIYDSKEFEEKSLTCPQWLADGRFSYADNFYESDLKTVWVVGSDGETEPQIDPSQLILPGQTDPFKISSFIWSPDLKHILCTEAPVVRFTSHGNLLLYSVQDGQLRPLTNSIGVQRNAEFSPDGSLIGFVRDGNIWTVDLHGNERMLTSDATETIYNGTCGWIYEEELGLAKSWEWSPDGKQIAYLQQDESMVPEILLPTYDGLHSLPLRTRYPRAGDPNPTVRLGILNIETSVTRWVTISPEDGSEFLVAKLQFAPDGRLLIFRLDRLQKRMELLAVDIRNFTVTIVLTETDDAWLYGWHELNFVDSDRFLWLSERSGYRHIYLASLSSIEMEPLTSGDWEVDDIIGFDAEANAVLFNAARPHPSERHVFSINLDNRTTHSFTQEIPGWSQGVSGKTGGTWLHYHSSLTTPPTVTLRKWDGESIATIVKQKAEYGSHYTVADWEPFTFDTEDGVTLNGRLLKPHVLETGKEYPVLMYNYGGPGSQVVINTWGGKQHRWYQYLSEQGYVVAIVENRGTGGRGRDFCRMTQRRLGWVETLDQITGAKYLGSLPFVDASRIAIWGWSYGGFMASNCLFRGKGVFKAAIAVAPVADWRLYDTIYTERYMGLPADNVSGYHEGSPITYAGQFEGSYLLVHGLLDDNVHFQNAVEIATALQDAKQPFETMFYPGKRHGIDDRHFHLFSLITDFLKRNL